LETLLMFVVLAVFCLLCAALYLKNTKGAATDALETEPLSSTQSPATPPPAESPSGK
jgi:hypothetical protein